MVAEHLQLPLPEGSAQDDGGGDHTSSEVHSMGTDSTPLAMEHAHSYHHVEELIEAFLDECSEQDNSFTKLETIYPHPNVGAFKPRSPGDILASQSQAKHIKYKDTLVGANHLRSVTALFTGGYSLISSSLPDNSDIMEEYFLLQRRTIDACLQEADKIERGVVENLLRQLGFPEHIRTQVNRKDTMEIRDEGLTSALQEYVNHKQLADLHRRPQYTSYRGNGQSGRNRGCGCGCAFRQNIRNQYQNRCNSSRRYGASQKN